MTHHTPLIATIVAGLSIAFLLGALAHRLKLSPLIGYLLAGVIVGPFTPGYVADQGLATELAEIGVILLMFGVGLHFSLKDLMSVRAIAIPGAVGQMAIATLLGMGLGHLLGWPLVGGFVFGLALSVASTVVLLRALQERRIVQTEKGRIAVGWLIVEDLAMVLALVMLPALAEALTAETGSTDLVSGWLAPLGVTVGKVVAFVAFMLIVGRRIIPWMLHWTAHTGSRELFRLAVLAIALGVAFGAAILFDVSFALGAFFAGMILAESELSQRAAEETLPLRDAFAVLFFVSVGMLFDPAVLVEAPLALLGTVAIIVVGKSVAAYGIVRAFRHDRTTALTIAASLAQIGEFSFILAGLGLGLRIMPEEAQDLILGGAIISILLNPIIFAVIVGRAKPKLAPAAAPVAVTRPAEDLVATTLSEHVVLVGYGRVGRVIAEALDLAGRPFLVIEVDEAHRRRAQEAGVEVVNGNAADPEVLKAAGLARATHVLVAIPDGFEAGGVVLEARRSCGDRAVIIARAHSDAEQEHLAKLGCDHVVMGERELAAAMLAPLRPVRDPEPILPAETAPAPGEPGRPLLSDAEWGLLTAARLRELGPGEALSLTVLQDDAASLGGFDTARLDQAVAGLAAKELLTDVGDGRIKLTGAGYLASAKSPDF